MKFKDIPKFTRCANYRVTQPWNYMKGWIDKNIEELNLDMNPDFQRAYVWTPEQKSRYVEYILKGGVSGKEIYFNCVGWMMDFQGPFVIVDGKQRVNAVLEFLDNKVAIFGNNFYQDFEDKLGTMDAYLLFNVNDLPTRREVLQWYLDLNTGGTIHSEDELNKVKRLLKQEKV